ncbi:MAG: RNA 2',3'-cyclic phosphodiesterase [Planctomycetota bacterium]|nr:RNA 2',3'-cyclic phosphodiesterase [Planctomycetota bacterium]NRA74656.1 RNA 2',3'-cyclic phosphodiesterase [Planctomycetota bacterium]
MTKRAIDRERRSSRRPMRLFCALHPEPEEARSLLKSVEAMESLPAHRVTPLEQVHMTVLFIGDVERKDLDDVKESVERAAKAVVPFSWQPDQISSLPARGPVRTVVAMGPSSKPLDELNRRLAQRLARRKNRRAFLPHMTLARLTPPLSGLSIEQSITASPYAFRSVQLMQSWLLPTGAEHQIVLESPLGG